MPLLKNMKSAKFLPFFLLFLVIPLASATITVSFSTYYTPNQLMSVTGTCTQTNAPTILQISEGSQTLWFNQVSTDSNKKFTFTYLPTAAGNYTLSVGCSGENDEKTFCVGTSTSCGTSSGAGTTKPAGGTAAPSTTSSGGGGGGYGQKCESNWTCSTWSYCNSSLQQQRTCTDLGGCSQPTTENKTCLACTESWVCSQWSTCSGSYQSRTCDDEHKCSTYLQKPLLQKTCNAADTGYTPAKVINTFPTFTTTTTTTSTTTTPTKKTPKSFWSQLWSDYQIWILIVLSTLLVLIILLLLFLHFHKPKTEVENIDELKAWVAAELARGTPKEKLKALITHHTGWTEEELHEAFEELKQETPVVQPGIAQPQPVQPTTNQPQPPSQPIARTAPQSFSNSKIPK